MPAIELLWNAPVSERKMSLYIDSLDINHEARVLDVGCGCGEVLARVCKRYLANGTGIDSSEACIAEAKRRVSDRDLKSQVEFIHANAETFEFECASFDLVICMGATHAFGLGSDAVANAIEKAQRLVVAGGLVLIADGYLKQPASREYREFIGDSVPDSLTHAAIVDEGNKRGLITLGAWTSEENEWDDFEWTYQRIIERKATENPDNDELAAKVEQRRTWMDGYLKWGRDTLGYGTHLFRKP